MFIIFRNEVVITIITLYLCWRTHEKKNTNFVSNKFMKTKSIIANNCIVCSFEHNKTAISTVYIQVKWNIILHSWDYVNQLITEKKSCFSLPPWRCLVQLPLVFIFISVDVDLHVQINYFHSNAHNFIWIYIQKFQVVRTTCNFISNLSDLVEKETIYFLKKWATEEKNLLKRIYWSEWNFVFLLAAKKKTWNQI